MLWQKGRLGVGFRSLIVSSKIRNPPKKEKENFIEVSLADYFEFKCSTFYQMEVEVISGNPSFHKFEWQIVKGNIMFIPSNTTLRPIIQVLSPGDSEIQLVIDKGLDKEQRISVKINRTVNSKKVFIYDYSSSFMVKTAEKERSVHIIDMGVFDGDIPITDASYGCLQEGVSGFIYWPPADDLKIIKLDILREDGSLYSSVRYPVGTVNLPDLIKYTTVVYYETQLGDTIKYFYVPQIINRIEVSEKKKGFINDRNLEFISNNKSSMINTIYDSGLIVVSVYSPLKSFFQSSTSAYYVSSHNGSVTSKNYPVTYDDLFQKKFYVESKIKLSSGNTLGYTYEVYDLYSGTIGI